MRYAQSHGPESDSRRGVSRDLELEGARYNRLRQVRAAKSVIPYVLCGCLYCLR
jgi:hypothetical protein